MVYILIAILIFGVLIAVHEFGHFLAAKACGVRVNEFAIGMGPAILKKTKGETTYALRLLPIGGFCAMEGEEEASDDPRALSNQGFWKKLIIFAAGALMNFLTGLVILLVLYGGAKAFYSPTITGFADGCPLQSKSGLQVGDELLSIDGERVYVYSDVGLLFSLNKDGMFDLVVRRDGQKVKLTDFPMEQREYADQSGGTYTGYGLFFGAKEAGFTDRVKYSWNNAMDFVRLVRLSLKMLVTGQAGISDLSGPVGIVSTITEVGKETEAEAGFGAALESILYFAAMFAVNLAVMNLLPLPALDGGHVLFLLVNGIAVALFKKEIPSKYLNVINGIGFALLMALMLFVTFHDIVKLL